MQGYAGRGDGDGVFKWGGRVLFTMDTKQIRAALDGVRECDELDLLGETPWGEETSSSTWKRKLYGKHDAMRWGVEAVVVILLIGFGW